MMQSSDSSTIGAYQKCNTTQPAFITQEKRKFYIPNIIHTTVWAVWWEVVWNVRVSAIYGFDFYIVNTLFLPVKLTAGSDDACLTVDVEEFVYIILVLHNTVCHLKQNFYSLTLSHTILTFNDPKNEAF